MDTSLEYELTTSEKIDRLRCYFNFVQHLINKYDIIKYIIFFSGRFDSCIALFVDLFRTNNLHSILILLCEADLNEQGCSFSEQGVLELFFNLLHGVRSSIFLICELIKRIDSNKEINLNSFFLFEIVSNYDYENEFDVPPLNEIEEILNHTKITFF